MIVKSCVFWLFNNRWFWLSVFEIQLPLSKQVRGVLEHLRNKLQIDVVLGLPLSHATQNVKSQVIDLWNNSRIRDENWIWKPGNISILVRRGWDSWADLCDYEGLNFLKSTRTEDWPTCDKLLSFWIKKGILDYFTKADLDRAQRCFWLYERKAVVLTLSLWQLETHDTAKMAFVMIETCSLVRRMISIIMWLCKCSVIEAGVS